ncbi:MAG TPA: amino acid adenylation domain-containing protein, partial [Blastocatellia bacterium]|nr:amino acid adenylation domain-containing protein [Blastocatellia bacterium]
MRLEEGLTRRMRGVSRQLGVSVASVCHVAWGQVVARTSGRQEVVYGTVLLGRMQGGEGAERAIGLFINTLPVKVRVGEEGAAASVRGMQEQLGELLRHEQASLALAQRCSGVAAPTPLFTSLLNYRHSAERRPARSVEQARAWQGMQRLTGESRSNYPLSLAVNDLGEGFSLSVQVAAAIGADRVCQYMSTALQSLVEALESAPARSLCSLEVVPEGERRQVVYEWNATKADYPKEQCVHELFEQQVEQTPEAVAVVCGEARLSYGELNRRANQLAHYLRRLGVGPDARVAICLERRLEMIIGLLGILKAGGAYVPLDSAYPPERLRYMLADSAPLSVLTDSQAAELFRGSQGPAVLTLTEPQRPWEREADCNPGVARVGLRPEHLAYVIYTSGSTGRPKGVMVEHRQLVNYVAAISERLRVAPRRSYALVSTFAADLGNTVLWPSLVSGGLLHVLSPADCLDGGRFGRYCQQQPIDCLKITPTHLQALLGEAGGAERVPWECLVLGGEALTQELVERARRRRPGCRVYNHYGPTESTVGALSQEVVEGQAGSGAQAVALGRPMGNMRVYILDGQGEVVPAGALGEVCIGGAGVTRGYWQRAEQTAGRFVADEMSGEAGGRLYRTGDRGRWLADGRIEYMGRVDDQVKVRGYRVELGEIEACLRQAEGVREAVVTARADADGNQRLVAYVVPDEASAYPLLQVLRLEGRGELPAAAQYELPNGMVISHQNKGESDYLYQEIFEREAYLRHGIRLGEAACVVDVGANIGLFTLFVLDRAPGAKVYAFEPIPAVYESLRINAAISGGQVRVFDCGLANAPGTACFTWFKHNSLISGRHADLEEEAKVIEAFIRNQQQEKAISEEELTQLLQERLQYEHFSCRLRTLSEVMGAEGIEGIDLLKVDVQKSELEVLEGIEAGDWPKIRQLVVEVHDIDGRLSRIQGLLESQGYQQSVEQDELLRGTNQYTIYARRSEEGDERHVGPPARRREAPKYWSRKQLIRDVRGRAGERLPEYMVPGAYVCLESLPLTPNGKLDRKALPEPEREGDGRQEYEEPAGETEQAVAAIWGEVLKVARVSRRDNFFELGGHSLLVMRVIARLRQALNIEVSISDVFEHPVLADFAIAVERATPTTLPAITPAQRVEHLPLSFAQQRLWFLAQMGASQAYHIFYGWRLKGQLDRRALRRALDRIVARHEALRTTFVTIDGEPAQQITPAQQSRFDLKEHDLRDRLDANQEMERLIGEAAARR